MLLSKLTDSEVSATAKLLLEFRKTKRFSNLHELCKVINMHLNRHNVSGRYFPADVHNQKSTYHLLFNISNAQTFIHSYENRN